MIGLLDISMLDSCLKNHKSDHCDERFVTFQHLITLLFNASSICISLRELLGDIVSYGHKISHYKFDLTPKLSPISDTNKCKDCAVYEDIYSSLVEE
jgi:hypothetical protein